MKKLGCLNPECPWHGNVDSGTIIHHRFYRTTAGKRRRYRCVSAPCGRAADRTVGDLLPIGVKESSTVDASTMTVARRATPRVETPAVARSSIPTEGAFAFKQALGESRRVYSVGCAVIGGNSGEPAGRGRGDSQGHRSATDVTPSVLVGRSPPGKAGRKT